MPGYFPLAIRDRAQGWAASAVERIDGVSELMVCGVVVGD